MIVVTGANGFIGSVMVWELNQRGLTDIIAVDTISQETRPLPLKNSKIKKFLLKDELWAFLQTPEAQKNVQWIVHMGANSSTTEQNWEHLYENNFQYSQKIFQWCTTHQKNLIYASSAATYGNGEKGYNDRTAAAELQPLNLYGKSKLIFDQWALEQKQTPPNWYGLKFFNVYGPNEQHKGAMSSLVIKAFEQIRETGQLKLFKSYLSEYKDGEQKRDFIYVKDVTRWMCELMEKKPKSSIYNMGFGHARTWVDLGTAIFSAVQKTPKFNFIEMPDNLKNQYQYFTEADMSLWNSVGLSQPKWSVEKGVHDYVTGTLSQGKFYL